MQHTGLQLVIRYNFKQNLVTKLVFFFFFKKSYKISSSIKLQPHSIFFY